MRTAKQIAADVVRQAIAGKTGGSTPDYDALLREYVKQKKPSWLNKTGQYVGDVGKSAWRELGEGLSGLSTLAGLPFRWGWQILSGDASKAQSEISGLISSLPKTLGDYYSGYKNPAEQFRKNPVNAILDLAGLATLVGGGLKVAGGAALKVVGKAGLREAATAAQAVGAKAAGVQIPGLLAQTAKSAAGVEKFAQGLVKTGEALQKTTTWELGRKVAAAVGEVNVGGTKVKTIFQGYKASEKINREMMLLQRQHDDILARVKKHFPQEMVEDIIKDLPTMRQPSGPLWKKALTEGQSSALEDLYAIAEKKTGMAGRVTSPKKAIARQWQPAAIQAGKVTPMGESTMRWLRSSLSKGAAVPEVIMQDGSKAKITKIVMKAANDAPLPKGVSELVNWIDDKGVPHTAHPNDFMAQVKTHPTVKDIKAMRKATPPVKITLTKRGPMGELLEVPTKFKTPLVVPYEKPLLAGKALKKSGGELAAKIQRVPSAAVAAKQAAGKLPSQVAKSVKTDLPEAMQNQLLTLSLKFRQMRAYQEMKKLGRPATQAEIKQGLKQKEGLPLEDVEPSLQKDFTLKFQPGQERARMLQVTTDFTKKLDAIAGMGGPRANQAKGITDLLATYPAADRQGLMEYTKLYMIKQKNATVIPRMVYNELKKHYVGEYPKNGGVAGAIWDTLNNSWRTATLALMPRWALVINPIGNVAMSALSGVSPVEFGKRAIEKLKRVPGKFEKYYPEELKAGTGMTAESKGIFSSLTQKAEEALVNPKTALPGAKGVAQKVVGAAIKVKRAVLDPVRDAAYGFNSTVDQIGKELVFEKNIGGMARAGIDKARLKAFGGKMQDLVDLDMKKLMQNPKAAEDALSKMKEFYYDYTSVLNEGERRIVRRFVAPFYSWYKFAGTAILRLHAQYPIRGLTAQRVSQMGEAFNEKLWKEEGITEPEALPEQVKGALPMGKSKAGKTIYWQGKYWNPLFLGGLIPSVNPAIKIGVERIMGKQYFPAGKAFAAPDVLEIGGRSWKWDDQLQRAVPAKVSDVLPSLPEHILRQFPQYTMAKIIANPQLQYDTASIFTPLARKFAKGEVPPKDVVRDVFLRAFGFNMNEMDVDEYISKWQKEQASASKSLMKRGIREGVQR